MELFGWCLCPAGNGDRSSGVGADGEGRGGEGDHRETTPKELGNSMEQHVILLIAEEHGQGSGGNTDS